MKLNFREKDPFSDFIQQVSPAILKIITELIKSTSSNQTLHDILQIYSNFNKKNIKEKYLESLSTLISVLIYDLLNIGLKTIEKEDLIGDSEIFGILERILEKNHDLPLFQSPIFPLRSIIDLFSRDEFLSKLCLKYIQQNSSNVDYYTQMKLPYYFDRIIEQDQMQIQGQVFTPLPIVDFIFDQCKVSDSDIIIDPAAGTGVMLLRTLELLFSSSGSSTKTIIAIEKDPVLSLVCETALTVFSKFNQTPNNFRVYNKDLFTCQEILDNLHQRAKTPISVLMNPPYTRQELISTEEKKVIREKIMSTKIISDFKQRFKSLQISGQSSLYIYFILYLSEFLNPGDSMGIIVPNSWMDVKYGSMLQTFLVEYFYIDLIVSTRLKKLIPSVDVNTAIVSLRFKSKEQRLTLNTSTHKIKFLWVNSKEDLSTITSLGVEKTLTKIKDGVFFSIQEDKLLLEPKWGIFAKAPDFYLKFLENTKIKLKHLKDFTSVRRGFTSGANDFFYLGKPGKSNKYFDSSINSNDASLWLTPKDKNILEDLNRQGFLLEADSFVIEREYWMHPVEKKSEDQINFSLPDNKELDLWTPNHLIKSPKEVSGFSINEEQTNYIVLLIPKKKKSELHPGVRSYITWGETWKPVGRESFAYRTTCASRKFWYSLPKEYFKNCPLLCIMTINDRYPFFYNPMNYYFDARFYGITPKNDDIPDSFELMMFLFLYLNTVFVSQQLELLGRSNLGEGGLDVKVYEYLDIKIPIPPLKKLSSILEITFQEVITLEPISFIRNVSPKSKKELDGFLKTLCHFSDKEISHMHETLQQTVRTRIEKAQTDFSYLA